MKFMILEIIIIMRKKRLKLKKQLDLFKKITKRIIIIIAIQIKKDKTKKVQKKEI